MKYLIVILVAAVPLTWLTVASLGEAVWGNTAPSGPVKPLDEQAIQAAVDQASQLVAEDMSLLNTLNQAVVAPYRNTNPLPSNKVSDASRELAALWQEFREAHALVERVATVSEFDAKQIPSIMAEIWLTNPRAGKDQLDLALGKLAERRAQLAEMQGVLQQEQVQQLAGVSDLNRVLVTNLQEIDAHVVRLELMKANLARLEKADQALKARQYAACILELDQWQGTRPELVDRMRQQAVFRDQVTKLLARINELRPNSPEAEWQTVIDEVRRFLDETPQPPAGPGGAESLAVNQNALDLLKRELARLTSIVQVRQLGAPTDLTLWLGEATAIQDALSRSGTDGTAARAALSSALSTWLREQLAPKKTKLSGYQYAKTSTGTIMEGKFEPYSIDSYRFVSRLKPAGSAAEIYTKKTIPEPPTKPPTELAVSEYNREIADIQGKLSDQAWWSGFREKCQAWSEALDEYEKHVGDEMDVNFAPLIRISDTILNKWNAVDSILRR